MTRRLSVVHTPGWQRLPGGTTSCLQCGEEGLDLLKGQQAHPANWLKLKSAKKAAMNEDKLLMCI